MHTIIVEAGWPIWPVLALGVASLVGAARVAFARAERGTAVALVAATIVMGALGTVLGLQHALEGIDTRGTIANVYYLVGLREALQNVMVALAFAVIDMLLLALGSRSGAPLAARHAV